MQSCHWLTQHWLTQHWLTQKGNRPQDLILGRRRCVSLGLLHGRLPGRQT